jgi:hypothetical protein
MGRDCFETAYFGKIKSMVLMAEFNRPGTTGLCWSVAG